MDKGEVEVMFTETHILPNKYNSHNLSRVVTGYDVTCVDCTSDKSKGYTRTEVNLTPDTPPAGYEFLDWSITGATLTGSAFKINNEDVTAKANYISNTCNITYLSDGHGNVYGPATATRGSYITLSNSYAPYYRLGSYSASNGLIVGNKLYPSGDCNVIGVFNPNYFTAEGYIRNKMTNNITTSTYSTVVNYGMDFLTSAIPTAQTGIPAKSTWQPSGYSAYKITIQPDITISAKCYHTYLYDGGPLLSSTTAEFSARTYYYSNVGSSGTNQRTGNYFGLKTSSFNDQSGLFVFKYNQPFTSNMQIPGPSTSWQLACYVNFKLSAKYNSTWNKSTTVTASAMKSAASAYWTATGIAP